jgi:hypothetical protein
MIVTILPEEVEQHLHNPVQRPEVDEHSPQATRSTDPALGGLKELACTVSVNSVGPTSMGNIGDLDSPNTVKAIGSAYLSAFSQKAKTYPYTVA